MIYKLRVWLISTLAVLLIVMAVAFTVLRTFLPHATEYINEIQQALSYQIGLPVSIDSIDADMSWFTPRLKLINVVIFKENGSDELLRLDEAIFELSYIDSLFDLSPVVGAINLIGADIYIERHPGDRWLIQGVELVGDGSNAPSSELMGVIQNTNFSLLDSDIHLRDYVRKKEPMDFIGVNLTFESFLGTHSLAVDMRLPGEFGDSLLFIASVNDDLENYKTAEWDVYIEGRTIDIEKLITELSLEDIPKVAGTLDGKVWLSLQERLILRVTGDLSVNNLKLANKEFKQHNWNADYFSVKLDWQKLEDGWRSDVRDLVLVKNEDAWAEAANIVVVNNNVSGLRATATYLRPFDLLKLPAVFLASKDLSDVEKLQSLYLGGDLYNIEVILPIDEKSSPEINGVFTDVDLRLADSGISIYGADGVLDYKKDHIDLSLLSESLIVDFGDVFRKPISADILTGEISARYEENDWVIESPDLHLRNKDIESHSRISAVQSKDGATFIDMQTNFINAVGASAYRYYPMPVMSDTLVEWLDSGITDGIVKKGSFILYGDAGKFPYENNDGVMEVVFSGKNLTLNYLEGWPVISNLYGDVRFYNSSLTIENGKGNTYGGSIKNASASIPDLNAPVLTIRGDIKSPADDMQKYIWNSGLDETLGDAMRQVQVNGDIKLDLLLEIPLDDDAEDNVKIRSELILSNNEIYFPSMEYLLSGVTGKLSFTENTITGEDIVAVFEGSPVKINAYRNQENSKPENIFHLTGNLPVGGLVTRLDWMPDNWLSGSSDWDVVLHIPDEANEHSVKIEMQTTLEGVEIGISDVLSKSSDDVLHLEMVVAVLDEGVQVDINSDNVVNLFATRDDEANWDFVVDSELIRGSGVFAEDLNNDSTARLRLERVNVGKLSHSSDRSKPLLLDPIIFPSLDVTAKTLVWDDWILKNVSLKTNWHSHGMLINEISVEGPSLKASGRGSWLNKWNNTDETDLEFTVESSDLGAMLSGLGITDSIVKGKSVAKSNWRWRAEPYNFSLETLEGTSRLELTDGVLTNLKPGTKGRLLGLFNAFKLVDRLALDFDDVYKKGFKFDSVAGNFVHNKANVTTDTVLVKAAAANMNIIGRIGITDRDYDMTIQVQPHSSGVVFATTALLGGLVVGATAVVLNKVLGIDKFTHDEYTVTGSWDNPVVVQVAKREREEADEIEQSFDFYEEE